MKFALVIGHRRFALVMRLLNEELPKSKIKKKSLEFLNTQGQHKPKSCKLNILSCLCYGVRFQNFVQGFWEFVSFIEGDLLGFFRPLKIFWTFYEGC